MAQYRPISKACYEPCLCHLVQKYIKAVEEAKEIQDRRSGKQPKTDHDPIDFLDPSTFPSSDSEGDDSDDSPLPKADLRPAPLDKEDAERVPPDQALHYLQAAARGDTSALSTVSLSTINFAHIFVCHFA